ncbi:hypothetical protein D8674_030606 [Pyrus ussuriensis x Pyrus communis]|uniref:RING-type domain-containing protein n=1 Tax=Pyrus ussuriensis x Pyrus communis TaxID=2448454 RepID=A0A5N5EWD3_9ROSA|nr:hypothetical protein D8674_030606 [Pyrus ussuriensis x Pyrus communis]
MGLMGKIASFITTTTIIFVIHLYEKNFKQITMFIYHRNPCNKDSTSIAPYCVVCLQEVIEGQRYRKLPICNHCFHVSCIDTWFLSHSTCPLCRTDQVLFVHKRYQQPLFHLFFSFIKFAIFSRENTLSSQL